MSLLYFQLICMGFLFVIPNSSRCLPVELSENKAESQEFSGEFVDASEIQEPESEQYWDGTEKSFGSIYITQKEINATIKVNCHLHQFSAFHKIQSLTNLTAIQCNEEETGCNQFAKCIEDGRENCVAAFSKILIGHECPFQIDLESDRKDPIECFQLDIPKSNSFRTIIQCQSNRSQSKVKVI